jgi:predicted esterase
MGKIKKIILTSVVLASLVFLFAPPKFPENFQFQEILNSTLSPQEVVIIFNSGGWGNTPFDKAEDFAPIIKGIQETLTKLGLNSVVIPYERTKNNFFGKITAVKEMRQSFQDQAEKLAGDINEYLRQNPGKKIIMAGLSNGGAFVNETMKKISNDLKDNVLVIEAGTPFWAKSKDFQNVLRLDNEGKDALSKGEIKILISSLIRVPLKWILAKILAENLSLSQISNQYLTHEYKWNEVAPQITSFLESKFYLTKTQ